MSMKWWIIIGIVVIISIPLKLKVWKSLLNKNKNDEDNY